MPRDPDDEPDPEPVLDPEARVHIDRSKLTKATPLTLRALPDLDWHLEPDELAF